MCLIVKQNPTPNSWEGKLIKNTNVNSEVIVIGNSEVSQLSKVHIPSSYRIQNKYIRREAQSAP